MYVRLTISGSVLLFLLLATTTRHLHAEDAPPTLPALFAETVQQQQQQLQQMNVQAAQLLLQPIPPLEPMAAVDSTLLREVLPAPTIREQKRQRYTQAVPNASQCLVTSTADSGAGSLRNCLLTATSGVTITFATNIFPSTAPVSITLQMTLPVIMTDHVTIDASNAGVILDGIQLPDAPGNHGLVIRGADRVTVRGLQILNFPRVGILLEAGATNAVIGGSRTVGQGLLGQGNLISANRFGIALLDEPTHSNHLLGNYVGVDHSGSQARPNRMTGIIVAECAHDNWIGGDTPTTRNVVSGNLDSNIRLQNVCTVRNHVAGNEIGVAVNGAAVVQGIQDGIGLLDAADNVIGGLSAADRNIIGGNTLGIWLQGANATGNQIIGNYVGIDASGFYSVSNQVGIGIGFGAHHNIVGGVQPGARNLISGNDAPPGQATTSGIVLHNGAAYNQILGNYIGVDGTGNRPLSNGFAGIALLSGTHHNFIGGAQPGEGNLISGNKLRGITIQDANTTANQISGNIIGPAAGGRTRLIDSPQVSGIQINFGAHHNRIGGTNPGEGNQISAHVSTPIGGSGISIIGVATSGNEVQGNLIGVDSTGQQALGNNVGIFIFDTDENLIGGRTTGARNLISGNTASGISVQGSKSYHNRIEGNWIGVNISGTTAISNATGIFLINGAHHNTIGGDVPGAGNLISGNQETGITLLQGIDPNLFVHDNDIWGNWIGVDASGLQALGNKVGIGISYSTRNNRVGGSTSAERNLISGNQTGLIILGGDEKTTSAAEANLIQGNWIGSDMTGHHPLGNNFGILIGLRTRQTMIGGNISAEGNVISGNHLGGISISGAETTETVVSNNRIGVAADGVAALGNGGNGVELASGAHHNQIGISNTIAYNLAAGVYITGTTTTKNVLTRNMIFANGGDEIAINPIPLGEPQIEHYASTTFTVHGHTCPHCRVEIFACASAEAAAERFLAEGTADAQGAFAIQLTAPPPLPYLTATSTDRGETSMFFKPFDTRPQHLYLPLMAR